MYYYLYYPHLYWVGHKLAIQKALRFLSAFPNTLLGKLDARRKRNKRWGFTTEFTDEYIESIVPKASVQEDKLVQQDEYKFGKGPNYRKHMSDIEIYRTQLEGTSISLGIGQELAPDPDDTGTLELNQRTRITSRTQRANSFSNLSQVEGAQKRSELVQAKTQTAIRSFLRTWVRVRKIPT